MSKRIWFLTGTRADFGKQLPLIEVACENYAVTVHVTGMHLQSEYGKTLIEVQRESRRCGLECQLMENYYADQIDSVTSTTKALNYYMENVEVPDLLIVHGDRPETLGGVIFGAFNEVLTAHIEGGEISGQLDESIRHAVSKLAHIHFTSNPEATQRLLRMGEQAERIYQIGSPEVDVMFSQDRPLLSEVMDRYQIPTPEYVIFIYHPSGDVEYDTSIMERFEDWASVSNNRPHLVCIRPNNDPGNHVILSTLDRVSELKRTTVLPSMRFAYFLTLMENAEYMIGNSSCMVREAPVFGTPSIVFGNRQQGRSNSPTVFYFAGVPASFDYAIKIALEGARRTSHVEFGDGFAAQRFRAVLSSKAIWNLPTLKVWADEATNSSTGVPASS